MTYLSKAPSLGAQVVSLECQTPLTEVQHKASEELEHRWPLFRRCLERMFDCV